MAKRELTHEEEASRGGARSIALWAVVSAVLVVWGLYTGFQGRHVAPNPQQSNTESPATSGSEP
jgi:hypothetical protein